MDNQISNNQIYLPKQQQANFAQQQARSRQAAPYNKTYGGAADVAMVNTNAGYVASKFEIMQHPGLLLVNIGLGLLASIGITQAAEYLVKGNLKKVPNYETLTAEQAIEHAPMARIGKKVDAVLDKIPFFNKAVSKIGEWKDAIAARAAKSDIFSGIIGKYKDGTKVTWSMGKIYEEGKGTEALEEFVEFLEKDAGNSFDNPKMKKFVVDILADVKTEKLSKLQAARQILEHPEFAGVTAKKFNEAVLNVPKSTFNKIFGIKFNLQASLAKAKFFNQATKGLGPIPKFFNSLSLMMMEGVGGCVLGSTSAKMAVIGGLFGLVSAFNSCAKAQVAHKEKQRQIEEGDYTQEQVKQMKKGPWAGEAVSSFMEDFAGFTVGGYVMTFPLGVALNKSLGLANLGRDDKAVADAAKKMGVQGTEKLYQRCIIKYNEAFEQDKIASELLGHLEGSGKLSIWKRMKKAVGLTNDAQITATAVEKLGLKLPEKANAETLKALLKDRIKELDVANTRALLKEAGKSTLTLKNAGFAKYMVQKPLELAAKIVGFDKFLMYKKGVGNRLRKIGNFGGGFGRIVFVGMVLTVPFRDAFMKASHKIFGKPSFSQYDEVKGVYDKAHTPEAEEAVKQQKIRLKPAVAVASQEEPNVVAQLFNSGAPVPAYQTQTSSANPYLREVTPRPVRDLDNYSYVPQS